MATLLRAATRVGVSVEASGCGRNSGGGVADVVEPGQPVLGEPAEASTGKPVRHEEEIILSLLRSADCLQRSMQQLLKPFGITATQYNVLRILRAAPSSGLTCTAVGRMMITQEPDVTRLLARMMAQKLVGQYRDPGDQRVVRTQICDKGLEVLNSLDGHVEGLNREILRQLSGAEMARLAGLLKKARICQASMSGGGSLEPTRRESGRSTPEA